MEKYIVDPVHVRVKESQRGSIYQAIVAMGFRSRQINDNIKAELSDQMADVLTSGDETDTANFDQISISREFDKLPKPTFLAMKEITDGDLTFELPEKEKEDE